MAGGAAKVPRKSVQISPTPLRVQSPLSLSFCRLMKLCDIDISSYHLFCEKHAEVAIPTPAALTVTRFTTQAFYTTVTDTGQPSRDGRVYLVRPFCTAIERICRHSDAHAPFTRGTLLRHPHDLSRPFFFLKSSCSSVPDKKYFPCSL
jgi:hypothetical protein